MKKIIVIILIAFTMKGCSTWKIPKTIGDPSVANNYGYHPLDPLPVNIDYLNNDNNITNQRILKAMPDETIRLAVGQVNNQGGITFSTASIGYEGNSYVVILDYVKFNTVSFPVKLEIQNNNKDIKASLTTEENPDVIVPVYIGIGLRLTANITVKKGSVNLGNLFAIGAEASGESISGTLVVQTLGISGENISSIIPMPGELNPTTIQNAIMALATIKSKIYDDRTVITPRVVGVFNNLGGGTETINGFISSILQRPKSLKVE